MVARGFDCRFAEGFVVCFFLSVVGALDDVCFV